jgi:hypothetical protein
MGRKEEGQGRVEGRVMGRKEEGQGRVEVRSGVGEHQGTVST